MNCLSLKIVKNPIKRDFHEKCHFFKELGKFWGLGVGSQMKNLTLYCS